MFTQGEERGIDRIGRLFNLGEGIERKELHSLRG
jgi:hypothetical protein